jgi:hypothetical protein
MDAAPQTLAHRAARIADGSYDGWAKKLKEVGDADARAAG